MSQQVKLTLASAFAQTNTSPADEAGESPVTDTPVGEEPLPRTWTHTLDLPIIDTAYNQVMDRDTTPIPSEPVANDDLAASERGTNDGQEASRAEDSIAESSGQPAG